MSGGDFFAEIDADLVQRPTRNGDSPDHADPGHPPPPTSMREAAFYGLAGDFVRTIDPHTESDPAAVLIQLLVAFGNACGRGPGFMVESDEHGTNEFVAIVGESSKARKGSSWGHVRRVMQMVDADWNERIGSGIASGEGLIYAVRDPVVINRKVKGKDEIAEHGKDGRVDEETDPGIDDKRLLVVESELAQLLTVMQREGNTVSPILRALWDHGNARGMSKQAPQKTTGSLVSLIGHITTRELRSSLTRVEKGNGFANRWLWVYARRSKRLARGGHVEDPALQRLVGPISDALSFAKGVGMIGMTDPAWEVWEALYAELDDDADDDLLAAVTARAEAHVRRLAVLYALLDHRGRVDVEHLQAAIAVWDYCAASAAHVFGGRIGDARADKVLAAIQEAPEGLTRTDIRSVVGNHVPAEDIDRDLTLLDTRGLAHEIVEPTAGRPAHRWVVGSRSKVREPSEQSPAHPPFSPTPQALSSENHGAQTEKPKAPPEAPLTTPEQEAMAVRHGIPAYDDEDAS